MFILEVRYRGGETHRYVLLPGETYTIGRKACRLPLPESDQSISRHHATIVVHDMASRALYDAAAEVDITVEDFSKHGTYVDGELVGRGNVGFVFADNVIRFGLRVTACVFPITLVLALGASLGAEATETVLHAARQMGVHVVPASGPSASDVSHDVLLPPPPMHYYEHHISCAGFLYVTRHRFVMDAATMTALGYGYTLVTTAYCTHLAEAMRTTLTLMPDEYPTVLSPAPAHAALRAVRYRRLEQPFYSFGEFLSLRRPAAFEAFAGWTFYLCDTSLARQYAAVLRRFGAVAVVNVAPEAVIGISKTTTDDASWTSEWDNVRQDKTVVLLAETDYVRLEAHLRAKLSESSSCIDTQRRLGSEGYNGAEQDTGTNGKDDKRCDSAGVDKDAEKASGEAENTTTTTTTTVEPPFTPCQLAYLALYQHGATLIAETNIQLTFYRHDAQEILGAAAVKHFLRRPALDEKKTKTTSLERSARAVAPSPTSARRESVVEKTEAAVPESSSTVGVPVMNTLIAATAKESDVDAQVKSNASVVSNVSVQGSAAQIPPLPLPAPDKEDRNIQGSDITKEGVVKVNEVTTQPAVASVTMQPLIDPSSSSAPRTTNAGPATNISKNSEIDTSSAEWLQHPLVYVPPLALGSLLVTHQSSPHVHPIAVPSRSPHYHNGSSSNSSRSGSGSRNTSPHSVRLAAVERAKCPLRSVLRGSDLPRLTRSFSLPSATWTTTPVVKEVEREEKTRPTSPPLKQDTRYGEAHTRGLSRSGIEKSPTGKESVTLTQAGTETIHRPSAGHLRRSSRRERTIPTTTTTSITSSLVSGQSFTKEPKANKRDEQLLQHEGVTTESEVEKMNGMAVPSIPRNGSPEDTAMDFPPITQTSPLGQTPLRLASSSLSSLSSSASSSSSVLSSPPRLPPRRGPTQSPTEDNSNNNNDTSSSMTQTNTATTKSTVRIYAATQVQPVAGKRYVVPVKLNDRAAPSPALPVRHERFTRDMSGLNNRPNSAVSLPASNTTIEENTTMGNGSARRSDGEPRRDIASARETHTTRRKRAALVPLSARLVTLPYTTTNTTTSTTRSSNTEGEGVGDALRRFSTGSATDVSTRRLSEPNSLTRLPRRPSSARQSTDNAMKGNGEPMNKTDTLPAERVYMPSTLNTTKANTTVGSRLTLAHFPRRRSFVSQVITDISLSEHPPSLPHEDEANGETDIVQSSGVEEKRKASHLVPHVMPGGATTTTTTSIAQNEGSVSNTLVHSLSSTAEVLPTRSITALHSSGDITGKETSDEAEDNIHSQHQQEVEEGMEGNEQSSDTESESNDDANAAIEVDSPDAEPLNTQSITNDTNGHHTLSRTPSLPHTSNNNNDTSRHLNRVMSGNSTNNNQEKAGNAEDGDVALATSCKEFARQFMTKFVSDVEDVGRVVRRQRNIDATSSDIVESGLRQIQNFLHTIRRAEQQAVKRNTYSAAEARQACLEVRQDVATVLRRVRLIYEDIGAPLPPTLLKTREELGTRLRPIIQQRRRRHRKHSESSSSSHCHKQQPQPPTTVLHRLSHEQQQEANDKYVRVPASAGSLYRRAAYDRYNSFSVQRSP